MALVSQEPTLYAGTVRFNILLGAIKPHDEVTQEEIESACRNANILEFIQGLPQYVIEFCRTGVCCKLTTSLGGLILRSVERAHSYLVDKNVSLRTSSDDNRFIKISIERIAIARALLRNPKVLLLDEVNIDFNASGCFTNSAVILGYICT